MTRSFILIFGLCIVGCASIQPPPGGPEDKTPPSLDTVMPHHRSLNVPKDTKLHFIFKQNIDRSSFTSSLSITPYMSGVVKYSWSGYDEVNVTLPEQLRENTTYVISVGKDLKTRRNGPLTQPLQIVFSTGSVIDTGRITGTMLPPLNTGAPTDIANISVFAYDITSRSVDTLQFQKSRPDFITQPNDKGVFEFKAMKVGHAYRIFALIDEFRNKVFDPGIDAFGVANKDILLDTPEKTDVHIRMAPRSDSVRPSLQDAEIIDAYHIRVRFSEPMDSATIVPEVFTVKDSLNSAIRILATYRENIERKPAVVMLVPSDGLREGRQYKLRVEKSLAHDLAGNPVSDSSSSVPFSSISIRDSFPPPRFINFPFADSGRDLPQNLDLYMSFTDAVDTSLALRGCKLVDSANKSQPFILKWIDGSKARLQTIGKLLPSTFYKLSLDGKLVKSQISEYSTKVKDTIYQFRFFTGDEREFGTVSGEVTYSDSLNFSGSKRRITIELQTGEGVTVRSLTLSSSKHEYVFTQVSRGKYRVRGWVSDGDSGRYDAGSVIPFRFGAPSGDYPDLIDVRPRWTVEKVNFEIH